MPPPVPPPASVFHLSAPFGFSSASNSHPTADFRVDVTPSGIAIHNFVGGGGSRRVEAILGSDFSTIASPDITVRVTATFPANGTAEFEAVGYASAECYAGVTLVEIPTGGGPGHAVAVHPVAQGERVVTSIWGGFPFPFPFDQVPMPEVVFSCHGTYSHNPGGAPRRSAVTCLIDTRAAVDGIGTAGVDVSVVPSVTVEQWNGLVDLP